MTGHVVGLDVGSTYLKAVLLSGDGDEVGEARRRTPWRSLPGGRTEMAAAALLAEIAALLGELERVAGGVPVCGIAVTGMAEAGALIDAGGTVVAPVVAWFDPRGAVEMARLDPGLLAEFPGRTGLPASPLATFAKLLHLRAHGVSPAGHQWLNLPEYVAHALGGGRFGEPSLRSRTGLVDQDTGAAWSAPLELLGAPDLLPPWRPAGSVWGTATRIVPRSFTGAVLTVAGHDHLVAAVGSGCVEPADLYVSIGTAEALIRVLGGPLDAGTRARLAAQNINVGAHLLPGRSVMIAGIKTGLLLRRVLQLIGVGDGAGRARLDRRVTDLSAAALATGAVQVSGADNSDDVLSVRVDGDGLSPELFFAAALEHSTQTLAGVLARMDREVGPAGRAVLSGGWASMRCVERARAGVLPGLEVARQLEGTAYGAALVAAFAAAGPAASTDLVTFTSGFGARRDPHHPLLQTSTEGRPD